MAQQIQYYGVPRVPTYYCGTDAERIAKPANELLLGDFWLVDDGTAITSTYMWNGSAWREWNV